MKESGGVRPITDCSRPMNKSVNCHTNESFSSFKFVKLSEILQSVTQGCYLCTVDIQAAYRSILIHPSERPYFGLKWEVDGQCCYMQDNCICFGAAQLPAVSQGSLTQW